MPRGWIKGKRHTQKTKDKISIAKSANPTRHWLGKARSQKTKDKIRESLTGRFVGENNPMYGKSGELSPVYGRHHTKETKDKIAESNRGKTISEKAKQKMSEAKKGEHLSPETEFKKGFTPWNKGKKGVMPEPWNKGKTGVYSKEQLRNILRRRVPTSLEEKFQNILISHNLPYKYVGDGSFTIGHYNPDFINVNGEKIAIEVYARYWREKNGLDVEDWKKERALVFKEFGWDVLFFDETQVNEEYVLNSIK